jgi:hypothetical protein
MGIFVDLVPGSWTGKAKGAPFLRGNGDNGQVVGNRLTKAQMQQMGCMKENRIREQSRYT